MCDQPFRRGCLQWWPRLFVAWTATSAARQFASNTCLALLALASHPYRGVRVMGGSACLPLLAGSFSRNGLRRVRSQELFLVACVWLYEDIYARAALW